MINIFQLRVRRRLRVKTRPQYAAQLRRHPHELPPGERFWENIQAKRARSNLSESDDEMQGDYYVAHAETIAGDSLQQAAARNITGILYLYACLPSCRSKETFNAESHFVALDHVDVKELPLPLNILFVLRIKAI